jgi:thioesterase domain-containing protein
MPDEVVEREFRMYLDVLVQHNEIIADFNPSVYHGPVLLIKAADKIMLKTSNPQPEYMLDDLGWGEFCSDLTVLETPGNHITMMAGAYAPKTADLICSWMSKHKNCNKSAGL